MITGLERRTPNRLDALVRLLVETGDITPIGARLLLAVVEEERVAAWAEAEAGGQE